MNCHWCRSPNVALKCKDFSEIMFCSKECAQKDWLNGTFYSLYNRLYIGAKLNIGEDKIKDIETAIINEYTPTIIMVGQSVLNLEAGNFTLTVQKIRFMQKEFSGHDTEAKKVTLTPKQKIYLKGTSFLEIESKDALIFAYQIGRAYFLSPEEKKELFKIKTMIREGKFQSKENIPPTNNNLIGKLKYYEYFLLLDSDTSLMASESSGRAIIIAMLTRAIEISKIKEAEAFLRFYYKLRTMEEIENKKFVALNKIKKMVGEQSALAELDGKIKTILNIK